MRIIKLYANELTEASVEGGIPLYGDIYTSREECLAEHPEASVIEGYGVTPDDSQWLVDESDDFYYTEEEAQEFINEIANG